MPLGINEYVINAHFYHGGWCRLHPAVQQSVQPALEEEDVHEGLHDVLRPLQVCAARHLRQPRTLREVLHQHDHPWQPLQVPLIHSMGSLVFLINFEMDIICRYHEWKMSVVFLLPLRCFFQLANEHGMCYCMWCHLHVYGFPDFSVMLLIDETSHQTSDLLHIHDPMSSIIPE